ncbi:hypothetical protein [Streptomyces mirabilis]|uniref:hypothetical protein n=1 Tax=Streptomyces mirabilis TaxID=68239 RepID=UPI00367D9D8C
MTGFDAEVLRGCDRSSRTYPALVAIFPEPSGTRGMRTAATGQETLDEYLHLCVYGPQYIQCLA